MPRMIAGHFKCRRCRYDLHGLSSADRCPECGTAILDSLRYQITRVRVLWTWWLCAIFAGLHLLIALLPGGGIMLAMMADAYLFFWLPVDALSDRTLVLFVLIGGTLGYAIVGAIVGLVVDLGFALALWTARTLE